ncbi:hypothetical protein MSHI_04830 [Mycobacterium shinjukuense]|uniref:Uncharacterized protein n=1 Tax=Mycobacterium shinjukuense TaxID=398694 RepID=A0A7I7MLB8_9MYCO|nr:hypothetical protein MSHI_04830 [Mycobacterium shinjukuense]
MYPVLPTCKVPAFKRQPRLSLEGGHIAYPYRAGTREAGETRGNVHLAHRIAKLTGPAVKLVRRGWNQGDPACVAALYATRSVEIDVLPIADDTGEIARIADEIEGAAGEFSQFAQLHGFSIDGVDLQTSALPDEWRDRLVKVQNENTAAPSGQTPRVTRRTCNHGGLARRVPATSAHSTQSVHRESVINQPLVDTET